MNLQLADLQSRYGLTRRRARKLMQLVGAFATDDHKTAGDFLTTDKILELALLDDWLARKQKELAARLRTEPMESLTLEMAMIARLGTADLIKSFTDDKAA